MKENENHLISTYQNIRMQGIQLFFHAFVTSAHTHIALMISFIALYLDGVVVFCFILHLFWSLSVDLGECVKIK